MEQARCRARHEREVSITIPQAARTVRLWIADSGALDEPIGPSPLLTDASRTADYKAGRAPPGQDLRGDAALISLCQRHLLIEDHWKPAPGRCRCHPEGQEP